VLFFQILGFALFIFWLLLIARVVVEFIRSFSRDWRPSGFTVVILEIIMSITDPPVKLLRRLIPQLTIGAVRYPGIKIHDPRIIRLLEVLLHGGSHVGGWTAKQIHHAVITTFDLSNTAYRLNQLRYDLRKLKGHGLLQRDGSRYAYRLTPKGVQVALLFLFFHKRLCGPLANSRFHHRPDPQHQPASKLEAAYHRADKAIQQIVDLLAA